MPLYEYQCQKCGSVFEIIQKFADEPLQTHDADSCGGAVVRLVSSPALQFKGSGFYITDYVKSGGGGGNKAGKGDGAKESSSKDSSTPSSPASSTTPSSSTSSSSSKSDK